MGTHKPVKFSLRRCLCKEPIRYCFANVVLLTRLVRENLGESPHKPIQPLLQTWPSDEHTILILLFHQSPFLSVFSLDCFCSPGSSMFWSPVCCEALSQRLFFGLLSLPPFSIALDFSRHILPFLEEISEGPLCTSWTGTPQRWISIVNKPPFQFHQNKEEDGDGSQ